MILYSLGIFLSAFLLFQVQPMIGKSMLPWFGGTPAVWSTLMLVFQVLLTGGYAYATWLMKQARSQVWIHLGLLGIAMIFLVGRGFSTASPLLPDASQPLSDSNSPILQIVLSLLSSAAVPFFVLASNSPLMQAWFSRQYPQGSYARLYAISNVGSLLGLLTYPFLIEPTFTLLTQGWIWTGGFVLFGLLTGWIVFADRDAARLPQATSDPVTPGSVPVFSLGLLWIALSATASVFLLSVTNQISQEVAVIPFLWILPLTIYLLSFILTFSGERGYHRKFYAVLFVLAVGLTVFVMLRSTSLHVYWQILAYCSLLFAACMICHGELYLLRPAAHRLTTFYLMVSIGGALGGLFVSLIAPVIFNGYWEFFVGAAMTIAILLTIFRSHGDDRARSRFVFTVFLLVTGMLTVLGNYFSGDLFVERNFYGVIRVRQEWAGNPPQQAYVMSHGITVHGLQFINSDLRAQPTTYYGPSSGVGLAILNHPARDLGLRVGMLGVGAGTLVTYGQPGDKYRLYEINPAVIDLAMGTGDHFSFLRDSDADIAMVPGDARISLQNELDRGEKQDFDVLALDTFSSDSIPVHLVTREAFALYLAHLSPDGVIAAHITNLHLDLLPVLWQMAENYELNMVLIEDDGEALGGYASHWVLLSRDDAVLGSPAVQAQSVDLTGYSTSVRIWTDNYSNLFQILK